MRLKIYKNNTFLSSQYVEHIINIPEKNFDFIPYILNHTKLFAFKRIKLIKKLFLEINNYQLKLDLHYIKKFPGFKIQNNNSTVFEGQIFIGEDADPLFRNEKSKTSIPIFFKHLNMTAFIEIEEALPLLFPLLFLNGTCPKLHGSTLREKSQYLTKNYLEKRIGRLGCDLSLLLYDQIIRRSISMNEKINQAQHLKLPLNSN